MRPNCAKLLGPLLRAVRGDKPVPADWREPLVDLVMLLMVDAHPLTSIRAARVIVDMHAANVRARLADNWGID